MPVSCIRGLGAVVVLAGWALTLGGCAHARPAAHAAVDDGIADVGEMPEGAFSTARPAPACKVSCDIPSASDATESSSIRVAAGLDLAMTSLRTCLTAVGASEVDPIILATYSHDGALSNATIDLGGIDAAQCIERARAVLPARTADASGLLRCSQRCAVE